MGEYLAGYDEPCAGVCEGTEEEGEPPRSLATIGRIRASLSCGTVRASSPPDSKLDAHDLEWGGTVSTSMSLNMVSPVFSLERC